MISQRERQYNNVSLLRIVMDFHLRSAHRAVHGASVTRVHRVELPGKYNTSNKQDTVYFNKLSMLSVQTFSSMHECILNFVFLI